MSGVLGNGYGHHVAHTSTNLGRERYRRGRGNPVARISGPTYLEMIDGTEDRAKIQPALDRRPDFELDLFPFQQVSRAFVPTSSDW